MSSSVFNTNKLLKDYPDICYIDTCAAVELSFNRRYALKVSAFIKESSKRGSLLVYSDHMLTELLEYTHHAVLQEQLAQSNFVHNTTINKTRLKQYEDEVNIGSLVTARYDAAVQSILNTPEIFVEIEHPPTLNWRLKTNQFMQHGLPPKDAKHAAVMHHNGVQNIFTLDGGFVRAPDFNVYGPSWTVARHAKPSMTPKLHNEIIL